jgi:hypothetical protein
MNIWISIFSFILILYIIHVIYFKDFIYTSFNKSNLKSIIVYKTLLPKIRLGKINDGGYVIIDTLNYDYFVSCGINDDISFENDLLNKYPNLSCIAFDGSINELPYQRDRLQLITKHIGTINNTTTTDLKDYIKNYNNIFLKMDIEEFEFEWLNTYSLDDLKKFKQITMEVHFDSLSNRGYNINQKLKILDKLAQTHWLVHVHPNNYGKKIINNGFMLPAGIEFTYIRKDIQNYVGLNSDPIPSKYDIVNNPNGPDIFLYGYPFTTNY